VRQTTKNGVPCGFLRDALDAGKLPALRPTPFTTRRLTAAAATTAATISWGKLGPWAAGAAGGGSKKATVRLGGGGGVAAAFTPLPSGDAKSVASAKRA